MGVSGDKTMDPFLFGFYKVLSVVDTGISLLPRKLKSGVSPETVNFNCKRKRLLN